MALIKSIRIRNFRSIVDETIYTDGFNCFVGKNDCGKSNVLKALNLFFNGKTDFNVDLDFENDYSKYAHSGAHQAKEIIISLEINLPSSYKDAGTKTWTKVWRSNGLHNDNLDDIVKGKSKAVTFLSRIVYLYIPAIKSNEYFKYLLTQVYESMTQTADSNLRELNDKYSARLQELTTELTDDLKNVLNIKSAIQMPQDLNVLFRDLTFSTDDEYISGIDLNHRGDGIKARHIPSILMYMQKNAEKYRVKNAIVNSYVWGYEEPENGIELSSCFDMANELYSYSNSAQLLITTHSPAFYTISEKNNTKRYYVYKSENGNSKYTLSIDNTEIDNLIGLMPIVAPYIQKEREINFSQKLELEKHIAEIEKQISRLSERILVVTEGKTDTKHLQIAFSYMNLDVDRFVYYDFGENETLGSDLSKLLDKMSHIDNNTIIIGIFDRDKSINYDNGRPFVYLGNKVYKTNIPFLVNEERKEEDRISIEHYYSNSEIKKDLGCGHLYLGSDFNEFGRSEDGTWFFHNWKRNTNIKPYSVIDRSCIHLQEMDHGARIASKDDFANYVMNHPEEFDFHNFINIYNLINEISEFDKEVALEEQQ